MKKTFIIALCCMALSFAACKPEPTPENVDYTEKYVGHYIGDFDLTIATINNEAITPMTFPVPGISMILTKGDIDNTITATVTVDNETRQTTGKTSADKIDFDAVDLQARPRLYGRIETQDGRYQNWRQLFSNHR